MGKKRKRLGRSLNERFALPADKKLSILAEAEMIVRSTFMGALHAACLYWAGAVLLAGGHHGVPLMLQAGSCSWRRLPEELDDGEATTGTHFTYLFEGLNDPKVKEQLSADRLPEMHVWVADPKRRELIDTTTRFLPQQCRETAGVEWLMPDPPPFVWTNAAGLRAHDCLYRANRDACVIADRFLTRELKKAGLL